MKDDTHIELGTYSAPQSGVVSAFWIWLRLCVSWVWPVEYVDETACDYEDDYKADARYTVNRHRRRFADKNLPAERYIGFYHAIFPRHITRGQFIERAARLSVKGRRKFYGTLSHSPRLKTKRKQFQLLGVAITLRLSHTVSSTEALWDAHLWPS